MTDDERLTIELQITRELFREPAAGRRRYTTDWSLLPMLLEKCDERGWTFTPSYYTATPPKIWFTKLEFDTDEGYDASLRAGDTLPLALCRAIVAVLDVLAETTNVKGKP